MEWCDIVAFLGSTKDGKFLSGKYQIFSQNWLVMWIKHASHEKSLQWAYAEEANFDPVW